MADMTKDIFAETVFGRVALGKMGKKDPLPKNFRLFEAGWVEDMPEDFETMMVRGAEFKKAKSGLNKGKLAIMIKGTTKKVYITHDQINTEKNNDFTLRHDPLCRAL